MEKSLEKLKDKFVGDYVSMEREITYHPKTGLSRDIYRAYASDPPTFGYGDTPERAVYELMRERGLLL